MASSNAGQLRGFVMQDFALRGLIMVAGIVSAALLILKGQAQAVPALALGATLGAFAMGSRAKSS
jgi:hypothetical protein